ncbi:helix-turn-helix domain-containing protein [Filimonas effusa]|uniref:XRE family transcriptional regulator n=1 Tax=Filimonas effusa TaxID=2508721 RepID=A0A4Q1D202_9BACT|nr:helix-turn-helix transcriptional regulator [Filimonas effusa]RXK81896.1 XRE family transcriptional regulator [Filimonas effusa]
MMTNTNLPSEIEQYVIDFVKQLRKDRKLSQEDIGNIIGVSRSYIQDIESLSRSATYNLDHINSLSDYFKLSPQAFLPPKAFPN